MPSEDEYLVFSPSLLFTLAAIAGPSIWQDTGDISLTSNYHTNSRWFRTSPFVVVTDMLIILVQAVQTIRAEKTWSPRRVAQDILIRRYLSNAWNTVKSDDMISEHEVRSTRLITASKRAGLFHVSLALFSALQIVKLWSFEGVQWARLIAGVYMLSVAMMELLFLLAFGWRYKNSAWLNQIPELSTILKEYEPKLSFSDLNGLIRHDRRKGAPWPAGGSNHHGVFRSMIKNETYHYLYGMSLVASFTAPALYIVRYFEKNLWNLVVVIWDMFLYDLAQPVFRDMMAPIREDRGVFEEGIAGFLLFFVVTLGGPFWLFLLIITAIVTLTQFTLHSAYLWLMLGGLWVYMDSLYVYGRITVLVIVRYCILQCVFLAIFATCLWYELSNIVMPLVPFLLFFIASLSDMDFYTRRRFWPAFERLFVTQMGGLFLAYLIWIYDADKTSRPAWTMALG